MAGVPPDYFSETGQRWGNPLYRWDKMEKDGFAWWVSRFKSTLDFYDLIRVDHFRGFESYWEIPADEPTAVEGRWVEGPGQAFFDALKEALGELPIIAEDLGIITPDVEALRDDNNLPGMKVLQFAFASSGAVTSTCRTTTRLVLSSIRARTTTTRRSAGTKAPLKKSRTSCGATWRGTRATSPWDLIRLAFSSVAELAVVPLYKTCWV